MKARKKIQVTILLSILLFMLIKLTFPIADNSKLISDSFWIKKTYSSEKYDFAVCGDSRVYRGFSVIAMENELNQPLKGINLGYSSAGYSDAYLDFIVSKLDPKAKERILILGITPHSLTSEAFKNDHLKSFQELSGMEIYKGLYMTNFLKHFAPYQPTDLVKKNSLSNENVEYKSDGWAATSWIKRDTSEAIASYQRSFEDYQVSDKEVNSFLKKVDEIIAKGIKVFAYRPPSTVQMRQLEDSISGFDEQFIEQELKKRNVIWIDFKDADFKSFDGSHLDIESTKKLSKQVGQRINEMSIFDQK